MAGADSPAGGAAPARAALAGNPSDGYGGAVIALALDQFRARATARRTARLSISPPSELVAAAVHRFARTLCPEALSSTVEWETTVPLGVGLGGSSAIVIATLRALCALHAIALEPDDLATMALAVEREDLGIAAGLQDRVAQAYGGLTFMDFSPGGGYERLHPLALPPLVVGWRADAAAESGLVHGDLRARFDDGDRAVVGAMARLASLARAARVALLDGDHAGFARCVDASFDARREMIELDARHVAMIECARACGAGANYTGSGGAIVAVCRDRRHRAEVIASLGEIGCATIAPATGAAGGAANVHA